MSALAAGRFGIIAALALSSLVVVRAADTEPLSEYQVRNALPNAHAKLEASNTVRIAYLGGSITAQEGWRPKTLRWLQEQFPAAQVLEINAAIGGTGSDLGVFRLKHDVLDRHPDLLFIEFAVNDGGAPPAQIHRCMEGIVRQTWKHDATTDICFVYTLAGNMLDTLKSGQLPRSVVAMEQIAGHYGIPSINLGLEVAHLEKAGQLVFAGELPKTAAEKAALGDRIVFSPDSVHPYPETGHQLYLESVVRAMKQLRSLGRPGPHRLATPFVSDNLELATMVPFSQVKRSPGWRQLDPEKDSLAQRFRRQLPELWQASLPGESISFRFRGTTARIYDLLGPDCGQIVVKLDEAPVALRPRFDAYCTYHRLATLTLADGLSNTVHQVELRIHPDQPDKAKILSQRNEKMDNPARFDGTAWYAGAILLDGELVE